jgi:hypothetical protein
LGDQIKEEKMGRECCMYGGEEKCIQGVSGKAEGKRPLGRAAHRWEGNTNMDRRWDGRVWTASFWLRIGTSGGLFKFSNDSLVSIKSGNFLIS